MNEDLVLQKDIRIGYIGYNITMYRLKGQKKDFNNFDKWFLEINNSKEKHIQIWEAISRKQNDKNGQSFGIPLFENAFKNFHLDYKLINVERALRGNNDFSLYPVYVLELTDSGATIDIKKDKKAEYNECVKNQEPNNIKKIDIREIENIENFTLIKNTTDIKIKVTLTALHDFMDLHNLSIPEDCEEKDINKNITFTIFGKIIHNPTGINSYKCFLLNENRTAIDIENDYFFVIEKVFCSASKYGIIPGPEAFKFVLGRAVDKRKIRAIAVNSKVGEKIWKNIYISTLAL